MNLQVCSNGHAEIAYYDVYKDCPFCKYIKEQEEIIAGLEDEVDILESQLDEMN